jgi:drug/metabolite transporter (DMT)-like permease
VAGGWLAGVALIGVEVAVPASDPDLHFLIATEAVFIAYLVVADAFLFVRRRRVIRPDYVAFAVAVCAGGYWIVQPVAWASFIGLGLAVASAAIAVSLWLHRDAWVLPRTGRRTDPNEGVGPVPRAAEGE